MVEDLFLQPDTMWEEVFTGPLNENFKKMLLSHSARYCDETLGGSKLPVGLIVGERYSEVKTPFESDPAYQPEPCMEVKARFGELMFRELPKTTPLTAGYMRYEMLSDTHSLPPPCAHGCCWYYCWYRCAHPCHTHLTVFWSLCDVCCRQALAMKDEMCQKMQRLPPAEFEGVLHPVFEADELKLILVGAALGAAAGFIQVFCYEPDVQLTF